MSEESRTVLQQRAIEVFCRELAKALNDAGIEMKKFFEVKSVDIPWSQDRVKDLIWREIQIPLLDKKSTKDLSTTEVDKVYEVLNRHIASNFGVHVPFPSRDNIGE